MILIDDYMIQFGGVMLGDIQIINYKFELK